MRFSASPLVLVIGLVSTPMLAPAPAASPRLAPAQAAPPAAVPPDTRPDFSGTWSLDRSISSDPDKASFVPANRRSNQGGGGRGGGFGGRGGFGGGSRSRYQDSSSDDMTSEEKTRLSVLTDLLKKGSATLVISHHD